MPKWAIHSIKARILIYFIPVTVAVLVVAGFFLAFVSGNRTFALSENLTNEIVNASNLSVEEWLNGIRKDIQNIARNSAIRSMDHTQYVPILKELVEANSDEYEMLFVSEPDGFTYTHAGGTTNLSQRAYFQQIISRQKNWAVSDALVSMTTGNSIFVVAVPILGENKQLVGLLGVTVTLNQLAEKLNSIKIGKEGFVFLTDGTGLTLSHPNPEMLMKFNPLESEKEGYVGLKEAGERMVRGEAGSVNYARPDGTKYKMIFRPIDGTPNWSMGGVVPQAQIRETSQFIILMVLVAFVVIIGFVFLLSFLVGNSFSKPMKSLAKSLHKISDYDLRIDSSDQAAKYLQQKDEIGQMTQALATMTTNLKSLVGNIDDGAQNISSLSDQLAEVSKQQLATFEQLAQQASNVDGNVQNTSASIEEVSSGVEEVAASAQNISKTAQELAQEAQETSELAGKGTTLVTSSIQNIDKAKDQTQKTAHIANELSNQAKSVGEILTTISSIAEQTNLLALNAAIEAARAGEAGKGFAVVADEIRKLAEESKAATRNISDILKQISASIGQADTATETTVELVQRVSEDGQTMASQFNNISRSVEKIAGMIQSLTATSEQQGAAAEEMASAMDVSAKATVDISEQVSHMSNAVSEQSQGAAQVSSSAEQMRNLAKALEEEIKRFSL
ncbi:MAG TPA: methyl-accepting chemotaxis protein [Thermotogota bacterium]|nr:methyl-accepting chemotaxis protein [Thermotogota bacterium]HRW93997.1 methyl-accepting chemotaxis protein [Thermotogota bacterium]